MKFNLAYVVLAVLMPACFTITSSFLSRSRVRTSVEAISAVRLRMQAAAEQLAQSLRRELSLDTRNSPLNEDDGLAAKDLLGQEVDKLANARHDPRGAELLRGYVLRAPPTALIWPVGGFSFPMGMPDAFSSESDFAMQPSSHLVVSPSDGETSETASSMSEETIVRNGKVIKRVTRCKNGKCVRQTKVGKEPVENHREVASLAPALSKKSVDPDEHSILARDDIDGNRAETSIAAAAQRMAKEMRNMDDLIGRKGFDDMLGDFFKKRGSEASSTNNAGFGHSESSESETIVENGQVIRRVRTCKDGHCTTQVQKAGAIKPQAQDHKKQKQSHVVDTPL